MHVSSWKVGGDRKKPFSMLHDALNELGAVSDERDALFTIANSLVTLGNFRFDPKQYRRALDAYREALKLALGNKKEARKNLRHALMIYRELGFKPLLREVSRSARR